MQRYEFDVETERWWDSVTHRVYAKESNFGEWVKFSDAQELQNEIDRLQSELEELRARD